VLRAAGDKIDAGGFDGTVPQHIRQLEEDIEQTQKNLNQLTKFTIRWFEALRKKYGAAYPRKTEISSFGSVNRAQVAVANETLYIDDEGFAGDPVTASRRETLSANAPRWMTC
jgi:hypothetical protein